VFDTMLQTVKNRFQSMGVPSFPSAELLVFWGGEQLGFNAFRHNPVDYAPSVSCPVLFLHGAHDLRVRPEEADRVFEAIAGPKARTEFRDGEHDFNAARFPREWSKAVSSFLDENLPQVPDRVGVEDTAGRGKL
ncbi:MAG: hypothetical protein HZA91_15200, partial [Verrucomicrobia bacterium]|nr:hypothetical protein [Verrucomicrobiota bacterium]